MTCEQINTALLFLSLAAIVVAAAAIYWACVCERQAQRYARWLEEDAAEQQRGQS